MECTIGEGQSMLRKLHKNTIIPVDLNIYVRQERSPIHHTVVRQDLVKHRETYHNIVNYLSKPKNIQFATFLQVELDGMLNLYVYISYI